MNLCINLTISTTPDRVNDGSLVFLLLEEGMDQHWELSYQDPKIILTKSWDGMIVHIQGPDHLGWSFACSSVNFGYNYYKYLPQW